MSSNRNNYTNEIDQLLNGALNKRTLRELYEEKLEALDLAPTAALDILKIQYRTLNALLEGTQKQVYITNLIKLANFLQISKMETIALYWEAVENNYPELIASISSDKIKFIKENFDIVSLKKAGVIDSINDFEHIEKKLLDKLALKSIFEYRSPSNNIAFSSVNYKPKNLLNRNLWLQASIAILNELDNPYQYSRADLIKYFTTIRWHSMNVEKGLLDVVKMLYKLGVTVIYLKSIQNLQIRGATIEVNGKPCIILSSYGEYYPDIWITLIHELYHVLFDWEDILESNYHISLGENSNEPIAILEREKLADDFARKYLFSKEKSAEVCKYINDREYVEMFAKHAHVHPSIIYKFHAQDRSEKGENANSDWARAHKLSKVTISACADSINFSLDQNVQMEILVRQRRENIYN